MNNPLVSIIIPTYNRAHLIGETLDSVLAQTYTNWECIVVDDGSIDYTDELLKFYTEKDSRIKYYHRPQDRIKGANACRNYGFEVSDGEWLIFLDSDDLLHKSCLQNRVRVSQGKSDVFIVFPMQYFHKKMGDTQKLVNRYWNSKSNYLENFLKHNLAWPITSLFVNRKKSRISFNENLMRLQDIDFSIRLLLQVGHNFIIHNGEVDCFYRNEERHLVKNYQDSFVSFIIQSYIIYFNSIHKNIILENRKDYTPFHKASFFRFNKQFLLPNIRNNLKSSFKLKKILLKYRYIDTNELIKLFILDILYFLNLHNFSGTGTYRLTKRWLG